MTKKHPSYFKEKFPAEIFRWNRWLF